MVSSEEMLSYSVVTKKMKIVLGEVDCNKIITGNQVDLNQQQQFTLMSVAENFFETPLILPPKSKVHFHTKSERFSMVIVRSWRSNAQETHTNLESGF